MPIYAYKCESCGHAKDVLQKISDAPLTQCPACGAETFRKQLTAAGFQLKGSGWYVTDFRGNGSGSASSSSSGSSDAGGGASSSSSASSSGDSGSAAAPAAGPCGGACACH